VEYESTEYCKSFGGIIMEMIKWGREHRKEIVKSQKTDKAVPEKKKRVPAI
jgi:DNA-binding HxlR family transcriptional regulator